MIHDIFPTKILVKDHEFSDKWNQELKDLLGGLLLNEQAKGRSFYEVTDDSMPVFTEANIANYPILKEVQQLFVDGFEELAKAFPDYEESIEIFGLDRAGIEQRVSAELGRLPYMKSGDFKEVHSHVKAFAFGILYLDDVDNESEGGELVLRDPSFNLNMPYSVKSRYQVATKKHRLVIAPAHVWHEVTQYTGDLRSTVVINLNWY